MTSFEFYGLYSQEGILAQARFVCTHPLNLVIGFTKGIETNPWFTSVHTFCLLQPLASPKRAKGLILQKSLPNRHWVEVERRPKVIPLAEPQDSHPCGSAGQCFAILIQSTRKTREEQWLFLEVVVATSSLGTPCVLDRFFLTSGFHRQS